MTGKVQRDRASKIGSAWYHPPDMYGIYRIRSKSAPEDEDIGTWRVQIKRCGEWVACRSFPDADHGGREATLAAAKAYRDEMAKKFKPLLKIVLNQRLRRNNTTGVAGVCHVWVRNNEYYIAQTELVGRKLLHKSFNIAIYGEERALALAIAERKRQLKRVEGYAQRNLGALPPEAPSARRPKAND